jgi:hypothetical protein
MTPDRSASEAATWRFSLKKLLEFVAVAAVVAWTIGWRHWHPVERLIFVLWFVSISAVVTWSRRWRALGILFCGAIGGIVPAIGVFTYYSATKVQMIEGIAFDRFVLANTCATLIFGTLAGGAIASIEMDPDCWTGWGCV